MRLVSYDRAETDSRVTAPTNPRALMTASERVSNISMNCVSRRDQLVCLFLAKFIPKMW